MPSEFFVGRNKLLDSVDETADGYCPQCDAPLFHGIATVTNYGNGPVELSGYYCETCDRSFIDGEDYINDEPEGIEMSSAAKVINVIHAKMNVATALVQRKRETPFAVKVIAGLTLAEDEHVLITDRGQAHGGTAQIVRVCAYHEDGRDIFENLDMIFNWAFQIVDLEAAAIPIKQESDYERAAAIAEAEQQVDAVMSKMPDSIKALANPVEEDGAE